MHFDAVHAFVAVARARSYAEAGRRLGVPRSTLSRQIQRLEGELGVRLLERTTRHVRTTEAGEAYFRRCAHALDLLEAADGDARESTAEPRGTLRITAPIDLTRELLAELLPEFRRRWPQVEIAVEVTQRRVDLVAEGFDLALRGGERLDDSTLAARKLATLSFSLFASPAYLAAHGVPASPADLADHDLVAFAPSGRALPWTLVGPDGVTEVAPRAWLRANEVGLLRSALVAGLGIGLLEPRTVRNEVRDTRLVPVLPDHRRSGGMVFAVYPSARRLPAKVRVFVDLLAERLAGGREEEQRG